MPFDHFLCDILVFISPDGLGYVKRRIELRDPFSFFTDQHKSQKPPCHAHIILLPMTILLSLFPKSLQVSVNHLTNFLKIATFWYGAHLKWGWSGWLQFGWSSSIRMLASLNFWNNPSMLWTGSQKVSFFLLYEHMVYTHVKWLHNSSAGYINIGPSIFQ